MYKTIQVRRDTAARWVAANPQLANGEFGFEEDTGRFKIGDGSKHWLDLQYFTPGGGGAGGSNYIYTQATPAASWPVTHNLNRYPTVEVIVNGELVLTDVEYSNLNQVLITFAVPTSGLAVLA
jgi:hypothetical protein